MMVGRTLTISGRCFKCSKPIRFAIPHMEEDRPDDGLLEWKSVAGRCCAAVTDAPERLQLVHYEGARVVQVTSGEDAVLLGVCGSCSSYVVSA